MVDNAYPMLSIHDSRAAEAFMRPSLLRPSEPIKAGLPMRPL